MALQETHTYFYCFIVSPTTRNTFIVPTYLPNSLKVPNFAQMQDNLTLRSACMKVSEVPYVSYLTFLCPSRLLSLLWMYSKVGGYILSDAPYIVPHEFYVIFIASVLLVYSFSMPDKFVLRTFVTFG